MSTAPIELPGDLEALRSYALRQHAQIEEKSSLVEAKSDELRILREQIRLLKQHRFGRKSEQSSDEQIRLFNEAELGEDGPVEDEGPEETPVAAHTRKKGGRRPLPEWIPRVEILHDCLSRRICSRKIRSSSACVSISSCCRSA